MPRIPLASIPNAPGVGNVIPAQVPGLRQNVGGIAGSLQQDALPSGFDGGAAGMAQVAKALGKGGEVFDEMALTMAKVKNNETVTKASLAIGDYISQRRGEMDKLPEDQWEGHLMKGMGGLQKGLSKLNASPAATEQINLMLTQGLGQARIDVRDAARKRLAGNAVDLYGVAKERAINAGKYGEAEDLTYKAFNDRVLSEAQRDAALDQIKDTRNKQGAIQAMNANVVAFHAEMQEAKKTGHSELFPWMQPDDIARHENISGSEMRGRQSEVRRNLFEGIEAGTISTEADIKKTVDASGGLLDDLDAKSARKALLNTVGVLDVGKYNDILYQTLTYDPKSDPEGKVRAALEREYVSELPTAEAQFLRKKLHGILSGESNTDVSSRVSHLSQQYFTTGVFGKFYGPDQAKFLQGKQLAENRKAEQKAQLARARFDDAWQQYSAQHPGLTVEDATKWAQERMGDSLRALKAEEPEPGPSGWSPFSWFNQWGHGSQGPAPQAAEDFIGQKKPAAPSITPTPTPAGKPSAAAGSVDDNTISLVKQWENFSPNAYPDYKQTSIGYGTRAKAGEKTITPEEADKRLREELSMHAKNVDEALAKTSLALTAGQRAALISFDFNTGKGAHLIETSDDPDEIAHRMALYTKVTENGRKVESAGLVSRRKKELELFNS